MCRARQVAQGGATKWTKAVRLAGARLNQEVTQFAGLPAALQRIESRQMDALNKQLDTLKTIVPEEKETDEFIRLVQGAAAGVECATCDD